MERSVAELVSETSETVKSLGQNYVDLFRVSLFDFKQHINRGVSMMLLGLLTVLPLAILFWNYAMRSFELDVTPAGLKFNLSSTDFLRSLVCAALEVGFIFYLRVRMKKMRLANE